MKPIRKAQIPTKVELKHKFKKTGVSSRQILQETGWRETRSPKFSPQFLK